MANVFSSSAHIKKEFKVIQVFSCTYQEDIRERGRQRVDSQRTGKKPSNLFLLFLPLLISSTQSSCSLKLLSSFVFLPQSLKILCHLILANAVLHCGGWICFSSGFLFFFLNSFLLPAVICPANWRRRRLHMLTSINNVCLCCMWTQVSNYYAKLPWIYQLE